jgi:hypothetical protein
MTPTGSNSPVDRDPGDTVPTNVSVPAANTTEIWNPAALVVAQNRQFTETAHSNLALVTELHHGFLLLHETSGMDLKTSHDTRCNPRLTQHRPVQGSGFNGIINPLKTKRVSFI